MNTPDCEVRSALYRVLGVDLTQIHGIGPSLALKLVGECGTDLAAWPSSKHFTSWLCLAPGNKIGWQTALLENTALFEPRSRTLALGCNHDRSQRHRAGRVLSAAIGQSGKGEGGKGNCYGCDYVAAA
ncbi:IS110 family transposase [Sphingobium sp. JS3065]|uniref:transposase n=1 Tax=Sphingobium sp. JS3065 TaxID=2970925 RepID=UPI002263EBA8|nr:transposase [Sphingobium sp. JS3065]UZW53831.1 IS110 family transposase [Sphingobium sp. JS3065]